MTLREKLIIFIKELKESIDWHDQTDFNGHQAETQERIAKQLTRLLREAS